MKAVLKNYRQSPRKVRLIARAIKGKSVASAREELSFISKKGAHPLRKLLDSAVANAEQSGAADKENLIVKGIKVNKGITFKRFMPVWRGMAHPIHRTSSHVHIELDTQTPSGKDKKTGEKQTNKETAKSRK